MIDGIEQAGAPIPSARRRQDPLLAALEGGVDPQARALSERLDGFSRTLSGQSDDAKAAREVALPLLLARQQVTHGVFSPNALGALREVTGIPRPLFDALCSRILAALDVRAHPHNLGYVLSQLTPDALARGGDAALVAMDQMLENLVGALSAPVLRQDHARLLLHFVLRPQARPAAWMARALHGLYLGYLQHRAAWPQAVPLHARMVEAVREMSLAQVEALGRWGPPLASIIRPVLLQALEPAGVGVYARRMTQQIAQGAKQPSAAFGWMMGAARSQAQDDAAVSHYQAQLQMRDLVFHALHTSPAVTFAIACALSREIGEPQARELWDQAVRNADHDPLPRLAQAFATGARLAWAPLTVLGEPGLALQEKLYLLCLLDTLVTVPLTARGWTQVAALHGIDANDADAFVAARGQAFIRRVFELERDDAMAALQATYAKAGAQAAEGKASKPRGFADHVPQVAQQLTALLMTFDAYERRCQPGAPAQPEFLKAQRAWVDALGPANGPLAEVKLMLRERLAQMEASLTASGPTTAWPDTPRPLREGKGEPDGDSGDES